MINQSYSSGGSANTSSSMSQTFGSAASSTAQQVTAQANNNAMAAWQRASEYNSNEARINREWQERMANSVYQRTVEDMRKAGINPVLAAGMGLGTAAVGGGSAASISPSQVYNAQTFADSISASQSQGNSWNQSENGIVTLANALTEFGKGLLEKVNASHTINIAMDWLNAPANDGSGRSIIEKVIDNPLSVLEKVPFAKDLPLVNVFKKNDETIQKYKSGKYNHVTEYYK